MKYYFIQIEKGNKTNVGCLALKIQDDEIIKQKILVDEFETNNDIQKAILNKWKWVGNIDDSQKIWIDKSTKIDTLTNRAIDSLIKEVDKYSYNSFLDYTILDLQFHFKNKNGRDANPFELNLLLHHYLLKVKSHFERYPKDKKNIPIVSYLQTKYSHTGDKITLDGILNSLELTVI